MKVRIAYTIDVPDEYRRAINVRLGEPGIATREQVKAWFRGRGEGGGTMELDDEIRSQQDAEARDATF